MASVERDDRGIWGKAAIAIPAIVLCGIAAGWLSNSGVENDWYAKLIRPGIQPPSWLFGPIWAALYALMGLAVAVVWNEPPSRERANALRLFFAQLVLNYAWSPVFFGGHFIETALVLLIVILVLALATAKTFKNIRSMAGWLLLPYLLWLCLAVVLNYETGRLNPGADAAPLGLIGA
ncbi:tryptophan-rich sensory protein [Sphingomonas sp. NSE70-1]|uniref:Tryptophan-rich sensory protein n=1 Tax=Sphingomonas caseinilyticus TaxID=2908205 RepID=A0ABT0RQP6_9SPHN|nr:TspO/MBR family protein [Sphingomonas caseinilyticus]MCL6697286.1 tryptophan-rich sensory protein [Sphingomonas caseinilyticus]